jgi:hypothetical protein
MYGFGDVTCTCPSGYAVNQPPGGTPTCEPLDPTWPPEAPTCAPPGSVPAPGTPAADKILGMDKSTAMLVGAGVLVAGLWIALR